MTQVVVCMEQVSKSFGSVKALDNLNLVVDKGVVFGLLGSNGAGKTTTARICSALMKPDEGRLTLSFGDDKEESAKSYSVILADMHSQYVPAGPRVFARGDREAGMLNLSVHHSLVGGDRRAVFSRRGR